MSSTHASLDAQANERKARLAKLKTLKRKQDQAENESTDGPTKESSAAEPSDSTAQYLSGRNYDVELRGPKLGFDKAPTEGQATLEEKAASIASETAQWQAKEEKADKPVDLFTLQPKKPNWDLKRDLQRKLDVLNVRTDNAIAKLVRQRIQQQQEKAASKAAENGENGTAGETHLGMGGTTLLEGVHLREKEEEEDERRAREEDDVN